MLQISYIGESPHGIISATMEGEAGTGVGYGKCRCRDNVFTATRNTGAEAMFTELTPAVVHVSDDVAYSSYSCLSLCLFDRSDC